MAVMRLGIAVTIAAVATVAHAQPADVTAKGEVGVATIKGRVVDDNGAPVAGATVMAGDASVVTDENGAFTLAARGTLTVIADGYSTVAVQAKQGVVVRLPRNDGEVIEISGKAPEEAQPLSYTMTAQDVAT